MKVVKIFGNIFLCIILAYLTVWAIDHIIPGLNLLGYLQPEKDKIQKTENFITQINKISEFTTACYCEEVIMHYTKPNQSMLGIINPKDNIVILAKGKIRAGFNLSHLQDTDLHCSGDTLNVYLQPAQIFDIIVNPSDIEIFTEEGKWSHAQIAKIENDARTKLQQHALQSGLLDKANKLGCEKMAALFKAFGFSVVNIHIAESASQPDNAHFQPESKK